MEAVNVAAGKPPAQAPGDGDAPSRHARNRSTLSFQSSTHTTHHSTSRRGSGSSSNTKGKGAESNQWLRKMTSWLTVAEPSAQALKHHRNDVFRRAGVPKNDGEANLKLHVPVGEIPPDAIRPAGRGPDPEDVLRMKAEGRRKAGKSSQSRSSSVFGSPLSQSSSEGSSKTRVENPIFPF
jgi:hypothetical protein